MTGWWFGTWLLCSILYMGCHPKPIDLHIFFRGVGQPPSRYEYSRPTRINPENSPSFLLKLSYLFGQWTSEAFADGCHHNGIAYRMFFFGATSQKWGIFHHRYSLWWTNILLWKDPPFFMGKSTISMAIFNSFLLVHHRYTGWGPQDS